MTKVCSMCKESKDSSLFYLNRGGKNDGFQYNCKPCLTEYNKQRYARPGEKEKYRNRDLKRLCGIDLELFELTLSEQGNVCKICKTERARKTRKWHADHDHTTGRFRGIICFSCNVGLGHFNDSPERLSNAIQYLSL